MTSFQAKWGSPVAGSSGGQVTWSFARYQGDMATFSASIAEGSFADAVRRAIDTWESIANIDFQEVVDTGWYHIDILLGWSYIDGPDGTLAIAHTSWSDGSYTAAEIEFDEEEFWVYPQNAGANGVEAYGVALHEIGHAIGLEHSSDPASIMYPVAYTSQMTADAIRDITFIYGAVFPPGFDALLYIASHLDLIAALGANAEAGRQHWMQSGRFEGRSITFDPLEYLASNGDLADALGLDQARATDHYLNFGWREGRSTDFDGLAYIASYGDLISAFGPNHLSGVLHFITSGRFEGRGTTFDGLTYIASYGDLINAFGTDATAGATHWINNGYSEGRTVAFDGLSYIASYGDLIRAFGMDARGGVLHFIANGHAEGRSISFDAAQYLASHDDLIFAFGPDETAAVLHWMQHGLNEGRPTDSFDEWQYLANYADLQAAFGADAQAATDHYIRYGVHEGRTDAGLQMAASAAMAPFVAGPEAGEAELLLI